MHTEERVPEYKVRLPDSAIAKLLGLTLQEYQTLSHRPIEAIRGLDDSIIGYYIHVSTNNPPGLLKKLHLDSNHFVLLSPEEVHKHFV